MGTIVVGVTLKALSSLQNPPKDVPAALLEISKNPRLGGVSLGI